MYFRLYKDEKVKITGKDDSIIFGTLCMDIVVDDKGLPEPALASIPILERDTEEPMEIYVDDIKYIRRTIVEKNKQDMVNHPNHYKTKSGIEAIDAIEAFTEGLTGYEAVETSNVLRYMFRWKKKNGLEDLKKAQWYLNRLIENVEKETTDNE